MTMQPTIRLIRWVEMAVIFAGLPLLLCSDLIPRHKVIVLWAVCAAGFLHLFFDRNFDRSRFRLNGFSRWTGLFLRFAVIAAGLALYTIHVEPQRFAGILRRDPALWGIIMVLYPLLSVVPQELVYRAFFFHRYGPLFANEKLMMLTNAALFAFGHILFRNWVAPVGAFFAGLVWASTYLRSRSLPVVSIEHALYGNLAFTLGIGYYFYAPDF